MTMTEKKENSRKTKNSSRATLQKFPLGLKDFVTDSFEKAKKVNMENYKNRLEENYVPANNISLHTNFQEAISKRENFSPTPEEEKILDLFLPGLIDLLDQRLVLNLFKSFLVDFTDYIRWIHIHHAHKKGRNYFSVKTIADVKAMTSAFTKSLLKAAEQVFDGNEVRFPPHIRDFYRCTCVCCNTTAALLEFTQLIVTMLTNPNSNEYKEFFDWVETDNHTYGGSEIPREQLLKFKKFRFSIGYVKNYISTPKGDYQAWQATITIVDAPKPALKGKDFEFKAQTWDMHECSQIGTAAQDDYKMEIYEFTESIFPLDNYFQELYSPNLDRCGLKVHDEYYGRESSGSSVRQEKI